jgi:hypothetical protein
MPGAGLDHAPIGHVYYRCGFLSSADVIKPAGACPDRFERSARTAVEPVAIAQQSNQDDSEPIGRPVSRTPRSNEARHMPIAVWFFDGDGIRSHSPGKEVPRHAFKIAALMATYF